MSVPKLDQGEKEAVAGRRERFTWAIRLVDSSGARCGLGASDVVRFKLATTEGATVPNLDFSSSTPTAAGSSVGIVGLGSSSTDATGTVELRRADTVLLIGLYYFELDVDDAGASSRTSQPIRGTIVFKPSMGGSIGA